MTRGKSTEIRKKKRRLHFLWAIAIFSVVSRRITNRYKAPKVNIDGKAKYRLSGGVLNK